MFESTESLANVGVDNSASAPAPLDSEKAPLRTLAAGMIGNFVEWYDFGVYGFLALPLAHNFFPGDGAGPLLATFAVFGVAFFFRPLGGLILGPLGDRIGRRTTLAWVVLTISAATMILGLLPTYHQVGWLAPILLVLLRCAQGFAAGGEYGGATSFIFEFSPRRRRGYYGGLLGLSTYLAFFVGTVIAFGLSAAIGGDAMNDWGWRIPFLLAAPIGLIGLYLRLRVADTPDFARAKNDESLESSPLRTTLRTHGKRILLLFGFLTSNAVGPYLLITYLPAYLRTTVGIVNEGGLLLAQASALLLACILMPLFGRLSDAVGRRPIMLTSTVLYATTSIPAFLLFETRNIAGVALGLALIAVGQAASVAITAVVIAEMFPTTVRYSAASVSYNLAYLVFGGTAPLVATWLVASSGWSIAPAAYMTCIAVAASIFVLTLPETAPRRADSGLA
ncbi:MFS transporter [Saccharopolyspora sp. ASAGF58]|uniref:MFS transporter n=1 Tax=Saccharopolyspora sp. ASAGF58 TaxID=2719023 RepID=UPI00143FB982|nr:MFS transporter [Saccharopolyspora sp. ASAGF58]QIZ36528.1 MHS family MFS transporter [Saccharopolyspora sp. ASAGF58]